MDNFPIKILYLRDDDIPEVVADGSADIGILGYNEVAETGAAANIVRQLGFGGCRISLAIPMALALRLLETDITPQVETLIAERERVAEALSRLPYVEKVYPSDANFLLVKVERSRELYDYLITRELIVRDRTRTPGCEGTLRITIGTPEENDRLIAEMSRYK